jgi:hypothetical protein
MEPARRLGRLLNPVVGDGKVGTRPGVSLPIQRTEPTAEVRPSVIDTQAPEFFSDWRFR